MSIERFDSLSTKPTRFVLGLMSGSSCDGVDAALVRIKGTGPSLRIKLIAFKTLPYRSGIRQRLLAPRMDTHEVRRLHVDLGIIFAEAAGDVIAGAREQGHVVDFIASHGHTVAHIPPRPNEAPRGTLQIADPAIIAQRTGLPTVSDFRPRDMAAGGQGAPLVPYADWVLFRQKADTIACLNIGGIANLTVVTPKLDEVYAFDTGPGNMPIDGVMRLLSRGRYSMDEDGHAAAKGKPDPGICAALLGHPYFLKPPPKSTGREEFAAEVYLVEYLNNRHRYTPEDLVASVTMVVAKSITQAVQKYVAPLHKLTQLVVGGGGAHNPTLMKHLQTELPGLPIFSSDTLGLPGDAREAIAFAILGNEAVCGTAANVPTATGASRPVVLGKITFP